MLVTRIMFFGILIVVAQKDVVARKFRNPTLHCVSDKEVVILLRSFDEHLSLVYALECPHDKAEGEMLELELMVYRRSHE